MNRNVFYLNNTYYVKNHVKQNALFPQNPKVIICESVFLLFQSEKTT
jgi:hypothetical protein